MNVKYFLQLAFVMCVSCNSIQKQGRLEACVGSGYLKSDRISFENVDSGNVYSDKIVSLEGYFAYDFEDVALYSALQPNKAKKDVWLNFSNELRQFENQIKNLRGKKVVVSGRLKYSKKGHLNSYNATMDSVFCIQKSED